MSDQVPDVVRDQVYEAPEGLEDFDQSDMTIPMLKIDHDKAVIVDGLSNQEYDSLDLICVGLIKQRVLWQAEIQDNDTPLCRSYNFKIGKPDADRFPWKASGFTPDADTDELPCENCKLQVWGSHPQREIPWCSEQHTYAVLQPLGEDNWAPALFTIQRSALKPSNAYLTSFIRAKEPLYVCHTRISLDGQRRGNVDFAIPKFSRGPETDQSMWPFYADTYRNIRSFVQTPRIRTADGEIEQTTGTAAAPAATTPVADPTATPAAPPQAAPPTPEPAAAPAAPAGEDLPF